MHAATMVRQRIGQGPIPLALRMPVMVWGTYVETHAAQPTHGYDSLVPAVPWGRVLRHPTPTHIHPCPSLGLPPPPAPESNTETKECTASMHIPVPSQDTVAQRPWKKLYSDTSNCSMCCADQSEVYSVGVKNVSVGSRGFSCPTSTPLSHAATFHGWGRLGGFGWGSPPPPILKMVLAFSWSGPSSFECTVVASQFVSCCWSHVLDRHIRESITLCNFVSFLSGR